MEQQPPGIAFPPAPESKAELMERIRRERGALERVLNGLSDDDYAALGPDGWSVKDHLAHLAAWERKQLALMRGRPPHEGLGVDEETYRSDDVDRVNAQVHERNRDLALPEVLDALRSAFDEMVSALEGMSEADLQRPNNPNDPEDTRDLLEGVTGNTYEHDMEHRAWIEALLARR
jgi:uncharacterized damage-inducible protein DinB